MHTVHKPNIYGIEESSGCKDQYYFPQNPLEDAPSNATQASEDIYNSTESQIFESIICKDFESKDSSSKKHKNEFVKYSDLSNDCQIEFLQQIAHLVNSNSDELSSNYLWCDTTESMRDPTEELGEKESSGQPSPVP